jgi:hypothetical protein
MKNRIISLSAAFLTALSAGTAQATLNIPSDGSDGALVITNNTVIDLSQAVTTNWNVASPIPGVGIHDPDKWAVVFKYSSVTIQGGATLTFKNHASRAPVVWLVQDDVTVNGAVNLNGADGQTPPYLAEPGPGGFRGGAGYYAAGVGRSAGFGPGGGGLTYNYQDSAFGGAGGSYGTLGQSSGYPVYGNSSLIPLIGGSGGGAGSGNCVTLGGGAGGGAILVACGKALTVSGAILANGGTGQNMGAYWCGFSGGGSGGAVRLIGETLQGSGRIEALGGGRDGAGGLGRIRIERGTNLFTGVIAPTEVSVANLPPGATPQIWLPTDGPSVRIVSIGTIASPDAPNGQFDAAGADVVLPKVSSAPVVVETTNVEQASAVTVRATPRSSSSFTESAATMTQLVSTNPLVIRWTANMPVNAGYSAFQVRVLRP